MEAQISFLILIIFSCIVEAQAVSVSDKLIVFQGHVFLSGDGKLNLMKIRIIAQYLPYPLMPLSMVESFQFL